MAVTKNFVIDAGASLQFSFRFKDTIGNVLNMDGYVAKSNIAVSPTAKDITSFAITYDQDTDIFTAYLSPQNSMKLNSVRDTTVMYDIFITSPEGFRTKVIKGNILINKSITEV